MSSIKQYYKVLDMGDDSMSHIRIIKGQYKGLEYQYGAVRFEEDEDNDCAIVHFEYEVFDNPNKVKTRGSELRQLLGDILMDNLQDTLADLQRLEGK